MHLTYLSNPAAAFLESLPVLS